jgi:hypothetical protein
MRPNTVRMRLWLGVGVATVAAVVATGAFGGSGGDTIATGAATTRAAGAKPTLAVVIVGSGRVTSKPAGISCPGKCSATFAAGSRVLLTPKAKTRSRFLRWGGACTGAGACRVRVAALTAVAAEFVGPKTQPAPPLKSAVEPGGYSGQQSQTGSPVTFFVPAGGRSVLNFSIPGIYVYCAGGGSYGTPVEILKATIGRGRSFTTKTSQSGVVSAAKAKLTYVVTGRFQGKSATGAAAATGVWRVDIVFADTPNRKCTSNDQPWTAARSLPPAKKSIEPGTYSGRQLQTGSPVTFLVPAGARSVSNFSIPGIYVYCAGGGSYGTPVKILKATIERDRSFTAKTSQSGVVGGANATITSFVTGYFQSADATGAATAAGVWRVDIVFTDTPNRTCTSNDQPWTAARSG